MYLSPISFSLGRLPNLTKGAGVSIGCFEIGGLVPWVVLEVLDFKHHTWAFDRPGRVKAPSLSRILQNGGNRDVKRRA